MKWLIRHLRLPPRRVVLWHSVAALPVAVLVAFGAYLSYYYHELAERGRTLTDRSYRLLDIAQEMLGSVEAAALAERDFVITGDADALAQFQQATTAFNEQVIRLDALLHDDARRAEDMRRIDLAMFRQFAEFSSVIAVRKSQGYEGARALIALQATTASMAGLRRQVGELTAAERWLLRERVASERRQEHRVILSGVLVAIVSIFMRFGIAIWLRNASALRAT
jgi:methyl-accepting chemotaxis protein